MTRPEPTPVEPSWLSLIAALFLFALGLYLARAAGVPW